ncbi:MAG: DUF1800 domain-containing protein [Candidatus Hydrogenedentes bacterium]|nr:DUF1800 domain-containing protein [Candidatus Hydrogenedentota bacterium]
MKLSRREFVRWAGAASIAAALTGCDAFRALGLSPMASIDGDSWRAPDSNVRDLASHTLARLSFGPRPGDYARVREMGAEAYIEEQLAPDALDDSYCDSLVRRLESLTQPRGELFEYKPEFLLDEMTRGKLLRAVYSRRQLCEVMVDFWSDHFNIDSSKGDCRWLKADDDRDVIRLHALGMFPDLLRASALSPAMLWYLDGRVNRKASRADKPNENYARELLELHTLGVNGGYTQRDVMETARCLTGWTVRSKQFLRNGSVEFHPDQHDGAEKSVLGHTIPAGLAERDLDEVLRLAAQHPATGRHIAFKLCRRFISDSPSEPAVASVAQTFQTTNGDIKATLRTLFGSDAFRTSSDTKIKRPFHYLASALRVTAAKTDAGAALQDYLLRMGHAPFQYPTPDGFPEEAAPWMGSLMWRWHFARALADNRLPGVHVDWPKLASMFDGAEGLAAHTLGRKPTPEEQRALLATNADPATLLASPGFQRF